MLATFLAISAGGLAAYYFGVHQPRERQITRAQNRVLTLQTQVNAALVGTATPPPLEEAIPATDDPAPVDPSALKAACKALDDAAKTDNEAPIDANAARFAVEELLRNTRLATARLDGDTVEVDGPITTQRLALHVAGETRRVHQLLTNIADYQKAGYIAQLNLQTPAIPEDESSSDRRRREKLGPQLEGQIEVRQSARDTASAFYQAHCVFSEE